MSEQVTSAAHRNTGNGSDPTDEPSRAGPRPGRLSLSRRHPLPPHRREDEGARTATNWSPTALSGALGVAGPPGQAASSRRSRRAIRAKS